MALYMALSESSPSDTEVVGERRKAVREGRKVKVGGGRKRKGDGRWETEKDDLDELMIV